MHLIYYYYYYYSVLLLTTYYLLLGVTWDILSTPVSMCILKVIHHQRNTICDIFSASNKHHPLYIKKNCPFPPSFVYISSCKMHTDYLHMCVCVCLRHGNANNENIRAGVDIVCVCVRVDVHAPIFSQTTSFGRIESTTIRIMLACEKASR